MRIKNKKVNFLLNIVYWAAYLTLTMALFEHYNIVPGVVPFGALGWGVIVEIPRVLIGVLLMFVIFGKD